MARVVSQRSGPPYLLIIFVFLFVVSTAIAVLVYLELDKARIAMPSRRRWKRSSPAPGSASPPG